MTAKEKGIPDRHWGIRRQQLRETPPSGNHRQMHQIFILNDAITVCMAALEGALEPTTLLGISDVFRTVTLPVPAVASTQWTECSMLTPFLLLSILIYMNFLGEYFAVLTDIWHYKTFPKDPSRTPWKSQSVVLRDSPRSLSQNIMCHNWNAILILLLY